MNSTKLTLRQDILTVLVFKLLFMLGLWFFCFSHPANPAHMTPQMAQHLFNPHQETAHD